MGTIQKGKIGIGFCEEKMLEQYSRIGIIGMILGVIGLILGLILIEIFFPYRTYYDIIFDLSYIFTPILGIISIIFGSTAYLRRDKDKLGFFGIIFGLISIILFIIFIFIINPSLIVPS